MNDFVNLLGAIVSVLDAKVINKEKHEAIKREKELEYERKFEGKSYYERLDLESRTAPVTFLR